MASFHKNERLTGKRRIDLLFDRTGKVVKQYPLLFILRPMPVDSDSGVQVLFSVSKKKISSAVVRNLIKRRLRSAHLQYKLQLYEHLQPKGNFGVGVVYLADEALSFQKIETSYKKFINALD